MRPASPFVHTTAEGGLEGAQPQTLPSLLLFFFFPFGRENRVFDSALFMFLLGNKRWLCVCVFSFVGFLKKWEEEKKKTNHLPSLSSLLLTPPSVLPTSLLPPFLFCCFVLLRVHIPVCNPWFARFSVFSKVSLRQLGSLPPSSPAGARWAGQGLAHTLPSPLPCLLSPPPSACARRRRAGVREGPRTSGAQRAPSRCSRAWGPPVSRLGEGYYDLQPAFGTSEPTRVPFRTDGLQDGKSTAQPQAGRKRQ